MGQFGAECIYMCHHYMYPNVLSKLLFRSTCNLLILSRAQRGDVDGALIVLEKMQKNDIEINALTTFNYLILAYANAG